MHNWCVIHSGHCGYGLSGNHHLFQSSESVRSQHNRTGNLEKIKSIFWAQVRNQTSNKFIKWRRELMMNIFSFRKKKKKRRKAKVLSSHSKIRIGNTQLNRNIHPLFARVKHTKPLCIVLYAWFFYAFSTTIKLT